MEQFNVSFRSVCFISQHLAFKMKLRCQMSEIEKGKSWLRSTFPKSYILYNLTICCLLALFTVVECIVDMLMVKFHHLFKLSLGFAVLLKLTYYIVIPNTPPPVSQPSSYCVLIIQTSPLHSLLVQVVCMLYTRELYYVRMGEKPLTNSKHSIMWWHFLFHYENASPSMFDSWNCEMHL